MCKTKLRTPDRGNNFFTVRGAALLLDPAESYPHLTVPESGYSRDTSAWD